MKKPTTIHRVKGDPIEAVKSDQKPKAARGISIPDKDVSQSKTLLKIEYLKRSKLFRKRYEELKSRYLEAKTSKDKIISMLQLFFKFNRENAPVPEFERWVECQEKREEEYRKKNLSAMRGHVFEIKSPSLFVEMAILNLYRKEERDPSIDELMHQLDSELSHFFKNGFFLFAHFSNGTREEYDAILKEVAEIIKPKLPKKRFMEDGLKRYLRVYDLREKGLKWMEIFFEVYPNREEKDYNDNVRRVLQMDRKKAIRAIKKLKDGEVFWWS
jgi:hypothetical protein